MTLSTIVFLKKKMLYPKNKKSTPPAPRKFVATPNYFFQNVGNIENKNSENLIFFNI